MDLRAAVAFEAGEQLVIISFVAKVMPLSMISEGVERMSRDECIRDVVVF